MTIDQVKPVRNEENQYADRGGAPSVECAGIIASGDELVPWARSLYADAGNLVIVTPRDVTVTFAAWPGGILPTWAKKVTAGTGVVAFYG